MTSEITLQMNDYLPLREVVFLSIRQAILGGQLDPGERLMEIHLAKQLGVSRTPVREAIRKLELEGLVQTIPRRGAVVAQITQTDLDDVLEVRTALEDLSVRKACKKMTADQLDALKEAAREFEISIEGGDILECAQADVKFHEIISESTGNRRLMQLLNNIRGQMYRYRLENLKNKGSHQGLIEQHRLIIQAIEEKDEEKAAHAVRMHIKNQKDSIIENLSGSIG